MTKLCTNCGKEMDVDATFCIECGTANKGVYSDGTPGDKKKFIFDKSMLLPAIGLALASTEAFAGLVVSIIALVISSKNDGKGKGVAISGIVVSSIRILTIIFYIVIGVLKAKGIID